MDAAGIASALSSGAATVGAAATVLLAEASSTLASGLAYASAGASALPRTSEGWAALCGAVLSSRTALARWLLFVAALRAGSAAAAYAAPSALRGRLYGRPGAPAPALTPLAARLFAAWTAVTALVCCAAAAALGGGSKALQHGFLGLASLTFAVALAHFFAECAVWRTVSPAQAAAPVAVAGACSARGGARGGPASTTRALINTCARRCPPSPSLPQRCRSPGC
jgi:hypothetical protein